MSVRIRSKSGKYAVLYRRGGRGYAEEWAGSFKTKKEATIRAAFVQMELAANRDPRMALEEMKRQAALGLRRPTLSGLLDGYMARPDIADSTRADQRPKLRKVVEMVGAERDPSSVTAEDIVALIADLGTTHKASTIRL
jgi:hypothetical protein